MYSSKDTGSWVMPRTRLAVTPFDKGQCEWYFRPAGNMPSASRGQVNPVTAPGQASTFLFPRTRERLLSQSSEKAASTKPSHLVSCCCLIFTALPSPRRALRRIASQTWPWDDGGEHNTIGALHGPCRRALLSPDTYPFPSHTTPNSQAKSHIIGQTDPRASNHAGNLIF